MCSTVGICVKNVWISYNVSLYMQVPGGIVSGGSNLYLGYNNNQWKGIAHSL